MRSTIYFLYLGLGVCLSGQTLAQHATVIVPGVLKKETIKFSDRLLLEPNKAELTPLAQTSGGGDASQVGVLFKLSSDKPTQAGSQRYELMNANAIIALGTPIPIEAEVAVDFTSRSPRASVTALKANSVGAWYRLEKWPDLRTIPDAERKKVGEAADAVQKQVTVVLTTGKMGKAEEQQLLTCYDKFADSIGLVFDQSGDFDVKRQLAIVLDGVLNERAAWAQMPRVGFAILNDSARTREASNPQQEKSLSSSSKQPLRVAYHGFEDLQAVRPALHYKHLYQQTRASVAIVEVGGRSFASGTIIGENLILTCAHSVAKPSLDGSAEKNSSNLAIRIGYDSPEDPHTPHRELPAEIVFAGQVILSDGTGDAMDFALLTADIKGYERHYLGIADSIRKGLETSKEPPEVVSKLLRDTAFWPIEAVPLANYHVTDTDYFHITGFPEGDFKKVCNHGKVMYPREISEDKGRHVRRTLYGKDESPARIKELEALFDARYRFAKSGGAPLYRFFFGNNSPGIGVVCSTLPGYSGAGAISKCQGLETPCLIGILVRGQEPSSLAWKASLERHEVLIPAPDIIQHLDEHFTKKMDGSDLHDVWERQYKVLIMNRSQPGSKLTPRPPRPSR